MRLDRALPWLIGTLFALVPLYPAFITLTGVTVPGVSLVSRDATIALLTCGALIDAALFAALVRAPRERMPTLLPLAAWLAAALVAAAFGFSPAAGLIFLGIYALSLVWHAAVLRFYRHTPAYEPVQWMIALSCAAASAAALVMAALKRPAELYAIAHGRAVGTFVLPGELAGYLIVVLPFLFALWRQSESRALRAACATALLVGLAAFVLTFSRAGWIGLAAAAACYAIWNGRIRRRYAPLIVAAGVIAVLALFNVRHNPAENFTRLSIWQAALSMIRRFPLTGVGPFDFARIYPLVRVPGGDAQAFHAHDVVLTMFAETGVLGVAALAWVWWRFAAELRLRLRSADPRSAALALALAAGLAGTWVQGLIDTVSVVIFGLWLPAMALTLAIAGTPAQERA
ncbi:MAG TPA: O-antigen ligase family protein [Candidatus Baltobacteraceae bacterium]|nr:O-antigen ligase family protein [Candidatus Baltobacteraceae bacterium]